MTSYLTSANTIGGYTACRNQHFTAAGASLPAESLVIISGLASPNMLVEVDGDAITPKVGISTHWIDIMTWVKLEGFHALGEEEGLW